MRHLYRLFVVAALLAGAACAGDATGNGGPPGSGTFILRLTTPHADDGAVLFELSGPAIDTVVAANASLRLFTRRANNPSTIVCAIVGPVAGGVVATLRVPASDAAAAYSARVVEVADRQNVLRGSLAGYGLVVER